MPEPMDPNQDQTPTPIAEASKPANTETTAKKPKTALWAGIAVVVIALLAGGVWAYMAWQNKDKTATKTTTKTTNQKVRLVYATHWTEKAQL
ncbi:MAG TPA: hypothetical protein VHQ86_01315, partial [Candidatus Saccharimonadia bacterium]|nr:hypothetical protein [Candidatus Saccharimonadia bacterium]